MRRYWATARAKVELEGRCRVGVKCVGRLEAAHVIDRSHDARIAPLNGEELEGFDRFVDPLDVVPLCERHHRHYDSRALDLLPYLRYEEQAAAVAHVGIVRALHRITSGTFEARE